MHVTFTKAAHPRHFPVWVATVGRRRIEGSILGRDPRELPHDVVTLVVERELGITDGFFGTVGAGGTFRSMAKRKNRPGRAVIAENAEALRAAEATVHREWDAWRAGEPTRCAAALSAADAQWAAVPPGGQLTLDFLPVPAHPARPKARTRRR